MKLSEVFPILPDLYHKKFKDLKEGEDLTNFVINKGNTGQFLERLLGLPNGSKLRDFEDGELKTNKAKTSGLPKETMFITQISNEFDNLFFVLEDFFESHLFKKISNLLYLPVVKEASDPNDWYFLPAHHVNITESHELANQLHQDYLSIKSQILHHLEHSDDGFIHTSNGKYVQIRSKDAKRKNTGLYNPIFSQKLEKYVSNKNHAFYFMKSFMIDIQNGSIKSNKIV